MTVDARDLVRIEERPVFFPPGKQTFFGIVTTPVETPVRDTGVIFLSGTQFGTTTVGRNRMYVRLARQLARHGFPAMRLDYAGIGESAGRARAYELDKPATATLRGAIGHLESRGVQRFVLVGTCFGARTAVAGALEDDRVSGVLLLAPPVRDAKKGEGGTSHLALYAGPMTLLRRGLSRGTLRKLVRKRSARSKARRVLASKMRMNVDRLRTDGAAERSSATEAARGFLDPIAQLVERGVPIRIVFGTDDFYWTEFEKAREGRLGEVLGRAGDLVEVATVPGIMRGFVSVRIQDEANREVLEWAERCAT